MTYIITYTGKKFDYANIQHEMIDIEDIAHALSHTCRYNGHCKKFYSVANHSIIVAKELEKQGASLPTIAYGLLHDATEAYMSDIVSPLKEILPEYKTFESWLMNKICERFELTYYDQIMVHEVDKWIVKHEMDCLFGDWQHINGHELLTPKQAEDEFMNIFVWLEDQLVINN